MSVNRRSMTRVFGNPPAASGPKIFFVRPQPRPIVGPNQVPFVQHAVRPGGQLFGQLIAQFLATAALRQMLDDRSMLIGGQFTGRCQRDSGHAGAGGGFRSDRRQKRCRFRAAGGHGIPIYPLPSGRKDIRVIQCHRAVGLGS